MLQLKSKRKGKCKQVEAMLFLFGNEKFLVALGRVLTCQIMNAASQQVTSSAFFNPVEKVRAVFPGPTGSVHE